MTNKKLDRIKSLISDGIKSISDLSYMGNSLYYYCCGKDPTPVLAFGSKYPLYVYSDSDQAELKNTVDLLNSRIIANGYYIKDSLFIPSTNSLGACIITEWMNENEDNFIIVYIQDDSVKVFERLYGYKCNYVQPKCICNIRHNLANMGVLLQLEKRVQFIMGHCHSDKYNKECEYPYHGDYSETKVSLYHREYYFLF